MLKQKLHRPDMFLFRVVGILVVIGLIMIYSASDIAAYQRYGSGFVIILKQLLWSILGMITLLLMIKVDYHKLQDISKFLLIASGILLVFVLTGVLGSSVRGAQRWIRLGPINFQPSELARLCLIIYLADFIDRRQSKIKQFNKGILPALIIMGIFSFLILMERDLGSPILIFGVGLVMLFVGGARLIHLSSLVLSSLPLLAIAIIKSPHRLQRLMIFLKVWSPEYFSAKDLAEGGYQLNQSLITLGSGGFNGVGLGAGKQKFFYLPDIHTDFIFPLIGEELGFIGTSIIITLFILFIWRGTRIAVHAQDLFGSLLAYGITFSIGLQAIINIGVVTGCLPTKGVTLPFLSFGGSSLLCSLAGVGILLNISKQTK
ncbi:MAG: putative lipid II flippase FtsW [bacterium]